MSKLQEHLPESLRDVEDRLACIYGDLDRMPAHKTGSLWHTDRVRERDHLTAALARLREAYRNWRERN